VPTAVRPAGGSDYEVAGDKIKITLEIEAVLQ
jgi:hypothetical protein